MKNEHRHKLCMTLRLNLPHIKKKKHLKNGGSTKGIGDRPAVPILKYNLDQGIYKMRFSIYVHCRYICLYLLPETSLKIASRPILPFLKQEQQSKQQNKCQTLSLSVDASDPLAES